MITILGAGGVIANEVVKLLSARKQPFRLVARNARPVLGGTEMISADLPDLGPDHPRRERLEHRISSR